MASSAATELAPPVGAAGGPDGPGGGLTHASTLHGAVQLPAVVADMRLCQVGLGCGKRGLGCDKRRNAFGMHGGDLRRERRERRERRDQPLESDADRSRAGGGGRGGRWVRGVPGDKGVQNPDLVRAVPELEEADVAVAVKVDAVAVAAHEVLAGVSSAGTTVGAELQGMPAKLG